MESSDDKLIDEIEQFPVLYDVDNPLYRRNNVRLEIWNGIANRLGSSSKYCQTKWKNIRYQYYKNKRDIKLPSGSGSTKKRKYTRDLSFLDRYAVDSQETCSNYVPEEPLEEVESVHNNESEMLEELIESSSNTFSKTATATPGTSKKRPNSEILEKIDQAISDVHKQHTALDAEDMFLLSYGDCLRSMDQKERNRVKYEITKIFRDAEDMFLLSYGDCLRSMDQKKRNRVKYEITKIFRDANC